MFRSDAGILGEMKNLSVSDKGQVWFCRYGSLVNAESKRGYERY